MKKYFYLLSLILLIAAILRFYQLGDIPPGLNRDEASIGYNAFSILKTGADEYAEKFPLTFKSFGDYKMPLYIYLTIPSVAIFGLTEFAVRLPSALFGVLTVLVVYFLVKELFTGFVSFKLSRSSLSVSSNSPEASGSNRDATKDDFAPSQNSILHIQYTMYYLPLITALFVAIAPWHIFYSRAGFEANVALTLTLVGLLFFLKGFEKNFLLLFSALSFILALYTYNTPYFFIPPIVLALLILYRKEFLSVKKIFLFSFLALMFFGFIAATLTSLEVNRAKKGITVFTDPTILAKYLEEKNKVFREDPLRFKLFYQREPVYYTGLVLQNYFKSFDIRFLFFEGDNHPWHKIPAMGNLYILWLPFILAGFLYLVKRKDRISALFLIWLFVSPLPSAITVDAPHTTRLLYFLMALTLISGFGAYFILEELKKRKTLFFVGLIVLVVVFIYNFGYFVKDYFGDFPKKMAINWLYGLNEAVLETQKINKDYKKIVMDRPGDSPYIYFLFYLKYPPEKFQKEVRRYGFDVAGLIHVAEFGNFKFPEVLKPQDYESPSLLITRPDERLGTNVPLKTIYLPDGSPAYYIFEK